MAFLPMFPLGLVLVPGMPLPLRVFEPRYVELVRYCHEHDPEFGVVLIARGRDVGGGDERFDVGCVARIVGEESQHPGMLGLQTIGTRRIRVDRWLPDDPFPRAEVEDWGDPPPTDAAPALVEQQLASLRRVLALAAEAGLRVPTVHAEMHSTEPVAASYELVALAPLPAVDKLALLGSLSVEARLDLLGERLGVVAETLAARLAEG